MESIWVFKVSFKMNFEHLWVSSSIKGPTTLIKNSKKGWRWCWVVECSGWCTSTIGRGLRDLRQGD